jgi:hypothetical protein
LPYVINTDSLCRSDSLEHFDSLTLPEFHDRLLHLRPYAKAIEPRLIALAYEFEDQDVQFVLISSNDATDYPEDSFENMKQRSEEKDYPFPYCYDESQEVAKAFGALCTPHCFLFDETRKLRYKGRVDDNWKDESAVTQRNLRDAIVALTQGNDPPVAEANAIGCSIKWKS